MNVRSFFLLDASYTFTSRLAISFILNHYMQKKTLLARIDQTMHFKIYTKNTGDRVRRRLQYPQNLNTSRCRHFSCGQNKKPAHQMKYS